MSDGSRRVSGGATKDRGATQEAASLRDRKVMLADVRAVSTGGHRNVDSIVHHYRRPCTSGDLDGRPGRVEQLPIGQTRSPQLDYRGASLEDRAGQPKRIANHMEPAKQQLHFPSPA